MKRDESRVKYIMQASQSTALLKNPQLQDFAVAKGNLGPLLNHSSSSKPG